MEYLEINGWKFYFHSCFLTQLAELQNKVLALKKGSSGLSQKERNQAAGGD